MFPKTSAFCGDWKCFIRMASGWINVARGLNYTKVVAYLYEPRDPSSLGIIRFLFGLLMAIDIFEERGGSEIDIRWGDPQDCHFPLFDVLQRPPYPLICLLYAVMWLGAVGVMLGFKFRTSVFMFGIPYWYILLLDRTFWNNHSYLFGLVTLLLMGSSAHHFFSVDSLMDKNIRDQPVPYWNYFILKFQFFILYFLAGLKKTDSEWLEGYSLLNLGKHWVFYPFRIFLSTELIDYLIIHWFGFVLDLTVGFWMLLEFSRPIAMIFCAMFHLMNSRLFSIGMFPYVCLATLPLFCKEDWPRKIWHFLLRKSCNTKETTKEVSSATTKPQMITKKQKLVVGCLFLHMFLQIFLPYSHFITQGFNTWTNGLYGYSWDMMVHSWHSILVVIKVVDNESGQEHFMDENAWTLSNRWNKYGDMSVQYAQCIKKNFNAISSEDNTHSKPHISQDISIYVDVWCSMNERFQQRMFNPNYNLLQANWSVFRPVEWMLPLMVQYDGFRKQIADITKHIHSWNNESDVVFIADFPGLHLENYIEEELRNVTLTILSGDVFYEVEDEEYQQSAGIKLHEGDSVVVSIGATHKVHTIGEIPSTYMYTFAKKIADHQEEKPKRKSMYSPFPLIEDMSIRKASFLRMWDLIRNATSHLIFGTELYIAKRKTH
ncbi:gamma-glutamyl carboxylase [Rhynchophorus ferrugineus]|uniref:gamma-glutamyl carboxylase n=1 Tax=Rhynchophorus ferrugineus TaxID=354439 RepID=UPI003FCEB00E